MTKSKKKNSISLTAHFKSKAWKTFVSVDFSTAAVYLNALFNVRTGAPVFEQIEVTRNPILKSSDPDILRQRLVKVHACSYGCAVKLLYRKCEEDANLNWALYYLKNR